MAEVAGVAEVGKDEGRIEAEDGLGMAGEVGGIDGNESMVASVVLGSSLFRARDTRPSHTRYTMGITALSSAIGRLSKVTIWLSSDGCSKGAWSLSGFF